MPMTTRYLAIGFTKEDGTASEARISVVVEGDVSRPQNELRTMFGLSLGLPNALAEDGFETDVPMAAERKLVDWGVDKTTAGRMLRAMILIGIGEWYLAQPKRS